MGVVLAGNASAGTLDRIGQGKTIRIAYRDDVSRKAMQTASRYLDDGKISAYIGNR